MTKLIISPIVNLQNETTAVASINNNFNATATAVENTLSRDGTTPNSMGADLDMNAHRILNLPAAASPNEPVRQAEFALGLPGPPGPQGIPGVNGTNGINGTNGTNGTVYPATSTTSLLIGTGSKVFTTQAGLGYTPGTRVHAASAANTANFMDGSVTTYSGTTLTVNVDKIGGSGTFADWNINLSGVPGVDGTGSVSGLTNHGVTIASGATSIGNSVVLTDGQLVVGATGVDPLAKTISGDATLAASGALTVTKTSGVVFGPVATLPGSSVFGMFGGTLVESHAANAATFAIKTPAGADPSAGTPVTVLIHDVAGGYQQRSITAAMSVVIPSTATLGTSNGVPFRLRFSIVDNAGALQLAVRNSSDANGVYDFPASVDTTVAIVGGSNLSGTTYSTSALTAKPYVEIACADYNSGMATAGTWVTSPSIITLVGPGYKKAGMRVQTLTFTDGTSFTTTSSTYATTNLLKAIVPTSTCNLVRYSAAATTYSQTSTNAIYAQMHRGTTAIGAQQRSYTTSGAESMWPASWVGLDKPNTAASVTYAIKIKNDNNTNNIALAFGGLPGTIVLEEITG